MKARRRLRRWLHERRKLLVMIVLLLAVAGLAGVLYEPLKDRATSWKANSEAKSAQKAAAAGDWADAHASALKSVQKNGPVEASRILVRASRRTQDSRVLTFAARLFLHPDAGPMDRAEGLSVLLDAGDVLGAGRLVQTLPSEALEDIDLRFEVLRYALGAGDFARIRALSAGEFGDHQAAVDLMISQALVMDGDASHREEVRARLAGVLPQENRRIALEGMRLLASLPAGWLTPALATAALDRFAEDPNLDPRARLHLALFHLAKEPSTAPFLIQSTVEEHEGDHLDLLTEWLLRVGRADRVLELTEQDERRGPFPLPVLENRIKALAQLSRYEQLAEELREPAAERIPPVELHAYRAAVAASLEEKSDEVVHWRRAFEAADSESAKNWFYRLAQIAGEAGAIDRQMEALARGIEHRVGVPPPTHQLDDLFESLYRRGQLERLAAISYRLLQRDPEHPVLLNNYYYFRALHGKMEVDARAAVRKLTERYPERVEFRSTLALVLLQSGDAAGAIEALRRPGQGPWKLPNRGKAIYASALTDLRLADQAEGLRSEIDWKSFPEAEATLLRKLSEAGGEGAAGNSLFPALAPIGP